MCIVIRPNEKSQDSTAKHGQKLLLIVVTLIGRLM